MVESPFESESIGGDVGAPTVLLLDVNETLLDMRPLDPMFERVLGDQALRPMWFAQMLQIAFVGTITSRYVDFTTAQRAALQMVAERRGLKLDDTDAAEIVGAMSTLPAYPDVSGALHRLVEHGFKIAALVNSLESVGEAQLRNAGIREFFDRVISADAVKRLKPAPEPYRMAAAEFAVSTAETCLVAAHSWDVSGALAAGCQAAFVSRPGMVMSPVGPQPRFSGRDIGEVADALISAAPRSSGDAR
jgi:2-haloacid dehalogenase